MASKNKIMSWLRQGQQCEQARDQAGAEALYKKALKADPKNIPAQGLLGTLYLNGNRPAEAADLFAKVAAVTPDQHDVQQLLGRALFAAGRTGEAARALDRAVALQPDDMGAHAMLGGIYYRTGHYARALHHLNQYIRLRPDSSDAHCEAGRCLHALSRYDEAISAYDRALKLDPGNTKAVSGKAWVLEIEGQHEAAFELLKPHLEGDMPPEVLGVYASLSKRLGEVDTAIARVEQALDRGGLEPSMRSMLHFKAGELLNGRKAYDRAFAHVKEANDLQPNRLDRAAHTAWIDRTIACFGPREMEKLPTATNRSNLPVFIVGMPRSGTSLVEQIIATHPRAYGAGELDHMADMMRTMPTVLGLKKPYPECVAGLQPGQLDELAEKHLASLRDMGGEAERVTDKMPHNFMYLGIISRLFPGARIIHCVRDARDNCLSCYFQEFLAQHTYASDLADLGFYYREYRRLMAHWKQVLNLPMLDVVYEEMVADQEGKGRELIDFIGLPWDDACLRFHETRRSVKTLSHDQVRQPIYKKSAGRWKHYEKHLGPLLEALEG